MTARVMSFVVLGPPVAKERPRLGKGGRTYTPKEDGGLMKKASDRYDYQARAYDRPVVLALDQAAESGYCIHHDRLWLYGLARKATERRAAIHAAFHAARARNLDLLVVYEDHSSIPLSVGTKHDRQRKGPVRRGTAQVLGMGDARGRWLEQLELEGHPRSWVIDVDPRTWRAKTIGTHGTSEQIKDRAKWRASRTVGEHIEDHNVAEAIVIAEWAALDGVARFLAAREMEQGKRRALVPFAGYAGGKPLGERPPRK